MKIRKLISALLCLVLMASTTIPAMASESMKEFPEDPVITDAGITDRAPGEKETRFEDVGNGKYYTEITDGYTLSVGIIGNIVDCSIRYNDAPNKVYTNVFEMPSEESSRSIESRMMTYRDKLLENEIELQVNTFAISTDGTRGDADLIMSALYSAGWPQSYTNFLRETRYQSGATGKLYHSVTYSYSSYINWFAIATTTLGAVITLTNLPATTLLAVASFAVTGAGVYTLIKDVTITRYNVFAYGTKSLYVQDLYQYYAGRTVKWLATVGDIGCSLEFKYDNKHSDYDDHNSLFATAFYNYFNLY